MVVNCTATVRSDRIAKAPVKTIERMKLDSVKRGEISSVSNDAWNVNVIRWKDNAVVPLTSNYESVNPIRSVKRHSKKDQKHIQIPRPHLINSYNKFMGGVDRFDSMVAIYRIKPKSNKWWWNHFCNNNISVMLAASYFAFKMANPLSID